MGLWVAVMTGAGILVIYGVASSELTALSKLLVVLLAFGGIGFAASTFMWSRYWPRVAWDASFWSFISGPAPEYEDALAAWRWGRRCRAFWVLMMASMFAVPVIEAVASKGTWAWR